MIKDIIDLLNTDNFYGQSEHIDIAKGKYALPTGWRDAFEKINRHSKKEPITWKDVWNKMKTTWQTKK